MRWCLRTSCAPRGAPAGAGARRQSRRPIGVLARTHQGSLGSILPSRFAGRAVLTRQQQPSAAACSSAHTGLIGVLDETVVHHEFACRVGFCWATHAVTLVSGNALASGHPWAALMAKTRRKTLAC